jgi:hypothetical protein
VLVDQFDDAGDLGALAIFAQVKLELLLRLGRQTGCCKHAPQRPGRILHLRTADPVQMKRGLVFKTRHRIARIGAPETQQPGAGPPRSVTQRALEFGEHGTGCFGFRLR